VRRRCRPVRGSLRCLEKASGIEVSLRGKQVSFPDFELTGTSPRAPSFMTGSLPTGRQEETRYKKILY
jgi:hypothetical protein